MIELWGLGDVALAIPFLRTASRHAEVSLVAKAHAGPLLRRFCPEVELVPFAAPWTAHRGKYRLQQWPWRELRRLVRNLRERNFPTAVSARHDPRDHALMALAGAGQRVGFPRAGSSVLLTDRLEPPTAPHRAASWDALAGHFGWPPAPSTPVVKQPSRRIVIHTGAAQPTRAWPASRYAQLAERLRGEGWQITLLDAHTGDLDALIATLATADRFIGNDSGPGHVAALLGVPTFTVFGAQLAANFLPVHPQAGWIEGAACPHKPCHDYCRFSEPLCITRLGVDDVWARLAPWLAAQSAP